MKKMLPILFLLLLLSPVHGDELHVDKSKKNSAMFIAKAPSFISLAPVVGQFEGKTDRIDGYVFWAGDDMLKDSELYFEVDLHSLDTGIGLRNRHMRENYLQTGKYPYAQLKAKMTKIDKKSDDTMEVTCTGTMTIHGVEKALTIQVTVEKAGSSYHVTAEFPLKLSDFKINRGAIFKISDDITVVLDYYLMTAPAE